jgi:hypothetical protein
MMGYLRPRERNVKGEVEDETQNMKEETMSFGWGG